jgi:ABC-2 type transport system permease protein
MKSILTLALKDIRLQTRDYFGLFWIVVFPVLYALFFGSVFSGAQGGGGRRLSLAVIDEENSKGSEAFVKRLKDSPSLRVVNKTKEEAHDEVLKGKLAAYLVIKGGFGEGGINFRGDGKRLELSIDPGRKADAAMLQGLLMEAVFVDMQELFTNPSMGRKSARDMLKELERAKDLDGDAKEFLGKMMTHLDIALNFLDKFQNVPDVKAAAKGKGFNLVDLKQQDVTSNVDQPHNSFEITFPQSILWGLMGCVASFSISIVIERNQGTFLRLRTSPLTWNQIIAGKGLACFLTSVFVITALLTFASLVLGVRLGNPALLTLAIVSAAFCFTGLMMLFSTLGKTEAGVAGAGWGIMMPMAMVGGGMIPLLFMPDWMQVASSFSPVKWGIYALEGAIWRGFGVADMLLPCGILLAVGLVGFALGTWKLKLE